jgi:hypothetical protein
MVGEGLHPPDTGHRFTDVVLPRAVPVAAPQKFGGMHRRIADEDELPLPRAVLKKIADGNAAAKGFRLVDFAVDAIVEIVRL